MIRRAAILLSTTSRLMAYMIIMAADPLLLLRRTTTLTRADRLVTRVQHLKIQQQPSGCRIGLHLRTPEARRALQKVGGNVRRQPIFDDMQLER